MVIKRGEIWWAALPEPRGSEPGFRRPVVIVSSNNFNESNINTVLVAVITSNLRLAEAPGNVLLPKKLSKLSKDSVINVSQVLTLDKAYLTEKISSLNPQQLNDLNDGLKLVLAL
jgi:mRNA interferase MazF